MNCSICKINYKSGVIRFWRDMVIHLCGDKECMDKSWLQIIEKLVVEGKIKKLV